MIKTVITMITPLGTMETSMTIEGTELYRGFNSMNRKELLSLFQSKTEPFFEDMDKSLICPVNYEAKYNALRDAVTTELNNERSWYRKDDTGELHKAMETLKCIERLVNS